MLFQIDNGEIKAVSLRCTEKPQIKVAEKQ